MLRASAFIEPDISPRDVVRAATRDAHVRVDALFSSFDLADPAGYRRFLQTHYAIVPQLEAVLAASHVQGLLADWPNRQRAASLAADLADLDALQFASARPATRLFNPAQAMGVLYVLEGARLGGAVLARRVLGNTDERCRQATRYLRHGEGERLWTSFVAVLNGFVHDRVERSEMVDAALETFDLFASAAHAALNGDQ